MTSFSKHFDWYNCRKKILTSVICSFLTHMSLIKLIKKCYFLYEQSNIWRFYIIWKTPKYFISLLILIWDLEPRYEGLWDERVAVLELRPGRDWKHGSQQGPDPTREAGWLLPLKTGPLWTKTAVSYIVRQRPGVFQYWNAYLSVQWEFKNTHWLICLLVLLDTYCKTSTTSDMQMISEAFLRAESEEELKSGEGERGKWKCWLETQRSKN